MEEKTKNERKSYREMLIPIIIGEGGRKKDGRGRVSTGRGLGVFVYCQLLFSSTEMNVENFCSPMLLLQKQL